VQVCCWVSPMETHGTFLGRVPKPVAAGTGFRSPDNQRTARERGMEKLARVRQSSPEGRTSLGFEVGLQSLEVRLDLLDRLTGELKLLPSRHHRLVDAPFFHDVLTRSG
jgi:hypothetical protein